MPLLNESWTRLRRGVNRYLPNSEISTFLLVSATVFLTRIPYLSAGYGNSPDAWRVARVARLISQTGDYIASRAPGNPAHELISSLLWEGGPFALNGATALMSAFAAGFLALIVRRIGGKAPILAGLTFAFVPLVFVDSVESIDPLWAIACFLGATYFAMARRPALAGILLGTAVGFRITSGALILPVSLLIYFGQFSENRKRDSIIFIVTSLLTGTIWFAPVFYTYGLSILKISATGYEPELTKTLHMIGDLVWGYTGLWGIILTTGIIIVTRVVFFRNKRLTHESSVSSNAILYYVVSGSLIILIPFFVLPHQRYLLPLVPLVLVLLFWQASRISALILTVVMLLAPFVNVYPSGSVGRGLLTLEHEQRHKSEQYLRRLIDTANAHDPEDVIVVGWWLPKLQVTLEGKSTNATLVYLLDSGTLAGIDLDSAEILYAPGMSEYNLRVNGFGLDSLGKEIPGIN